MVNYSYSRRNLPTSGLERLYDLLLKELSDSDRAALRQGGIHRISEDGRRKVDKFYYVVGKCVIVGALRLQEILMLEGENYGARGRQVSTQAYEAQCIGEVMNTVYETLDETSEALDGYLGEIPERGNCPGVLIAGRLLNSVPVNKNGYLRMIGKRVSNILRGNSAKRVVEKLKSVPPYDEEPYVAKASLELEDLLKESVEKAVIDYKNQYKR
jgi:hypothetical protein